MENYNKYLRRCLSGMPYAQAYWIDRQEGDTGCPVHSLYSYDSKICDIVEASDGVLVVSAEDAGAAINCSRTTSRQVTFALREYMRNDLLQAVKRALTKTDTTRVLVDADGCIALNGTAQNQAFLA